MDDLSQPSRLKNVPTRTVYSSAPHDNNGLPINQDDAKRALTCVEYLWSYCKFDSVEEQKAAQASKDIVTAALQQPLPMGVDERTLKDAKHPVMENSYAIRSGNPSVKSGYMYGWNECIDYLSFKGHLRTETGWKSIDSYDYNKLPQVLLAGFITPSEYAQYNGAKPFWEISIGRCWYVNTRKFTGFLGQQPTHWQPLPAAPEASEG